MLNSSVSQYCIASVLSMARALPAACIPTDTPQAWAHCDDPASSAEVEAKMYLAVGAGAAPLHQKEVSNSAFETQVQLLQSIDYRDAH